MVLNKFLPSAKFVIRESKECCVVGRTPNKVTSNAGELGCLQLKTWYGGKKSDKGLMESQVIRVFKKVLRSARFATGCWKNADCVNVGETRREEIPFSWPEMLKLVVRYNTLDIQLSVMVILKLKSVCLVLSLLNKKGYH